MKRDRGDGGIDTRGKDRHRLRWRVDGKRYSKTLKGSISEARRELRRVLKTADDGQHVAPAKLTLAAWADQWLALKRVNARSIERYEQLLRLHILPVLGDRPIQQITATEIDRLYSGLERHLAPRSVRLVRIVLGDCLKTAVRKKLLVANPADDAEIPAGSKDEVGRALDRNELAALLAGFRGSPLYPIVAFAVRTGARRNEILALRWLDIAGNIVTISRSLELSKAHGRRFKEPKTSRSRRSFTIDEDLMNLLEEVRQKHLRLHAGVPDGVDVDLSLIRLPEDALIFSSGSDLSRPRNPHTLTRLFGWRAHKVGFAGLRFHDLRATHETLLLDAGVPVHVVAARGGHDPATLLRAYAKRTQQADDRAAAIIAALGRL